MFPLHLEKQTEQIFSQYFRQFADEINRKVVSVLRKSLKSDIRHDSLNDLIRLLEETQEQFGETVTSEKLERVLQKNYQMVDHAAMQLTNKALGKISTVKSDDVRFNFNRSSIYSDNVIQSKVRAGVEMLDNLNKKHSDDVFRAVFDGIKNGDSFTTIKDEIRKRTGFNENKARFWARDQTGDISAQLNKVRQPEAGFPGYIWRSMKDARVRDPHIDNSGKFFYWSEGANNLQKSGAHHPGEDHECRCYPEPAMSPPSEQEQEKENISSVLAREEDILKTKAVTGLRPPPNGSKGYQFERIRNENPGELAILSEDEALAVHAWTTPYWYNKINPILRVRGELSGNSEKILKNLMGATEKLPNYQGTVYREVDKNFEQVFNKIKRTGILQDDGFLSATKNKNLTLWEWKRVKAKYRFVIESNAGKDITNLSWVNPRTNKNIEEVIFAPGSKFEVIDIDETQEPVIIKLQETIMKERKDSGRQRAMTPEEIRAALERVEEKRRKGLLPVDPEAEAAAKEWDAMTPEERKEWEIDLERFRN